MNSARSVLTELVKHLESDATWTGQSENGMRVGRFGFSREPDSLWSRIRAVMASGEAHDDNMKLLIRLCESLLRNSNLLNGEMIGSLTLSTQEGSLWYYAQKSVGSTT